MESWGLRVDYGESIDQVHHQFAGTIELRRSDLQKALDDSGVSAIWCARGGYGTVQIIDGLDFSKFSRAPKWIMGYSDVTVLHRKVQRLGFQSLHCFMPLELNDNDAVSRARFRESVLPSDSANTSESEPLSVKGFYDGDTISGPLLGGNLSILYSLLGSDLMEMEKGGILFIEEIDEYVYHIERMLYALKRAGILEQVKAVLVGGMTDMRDHQIPFGKSAEQVITDICALTQTPVFFNVPSGHIKNHRSLKLGANTTIKASSEGFQIIQE